MKNGKAPSRSQKILMKSHGLNPDNNLVVKDTPEFMEVVSRMALKKQKIQGAKPRTRKLYKDS